MWSKTISVIIEKGMRQGIPEKMHEIVVSFYGSSEAYCSFLEINDKSQCYTCLIDKSGTIKWRGRGRASASDIQEMLRAVWELKK